MCIFLVKSYKKGFTVFLSPALLRPLNLKEHVTNQHADVSRNLQTKGHV